MAGKEKRRGAGDADGRRETYKDHEIFFPGDERWRRVFIDGRPVHYGVAGGQYYLDVYAYDRADSLDEVLRRYLDYVELTQPHGTNQA